MSERDEPRLLLLLDACCLLDLFATWHIEHILRTLQRRYAIAAAVKAEAKWIYRGGTGEDALDCDTLDTEPLVAAGVECAGTINRIVEHGRPDARVEQRGVH